MKALLLTIVEGCANSPWWSRLYFWSSGTLLVATGAAKLWSAMGSDQVLAMQDELLLVRNRELMIAVGLLEIIVAGILFCCRKPLYGAGALFWLSTNFWLYRAGMMFTVSAYCPCLGNLYAELGMKPNVVNGVLTAIVAYFSIGSISILWACRGALLTALPNLHAKRRLSTG